MIALFANAPAPYPGRQHRKLLTRQTPGGAMKQTKIDLLEPFEKIFEALLSVPESNKVIGEDAAQNAAGAISAKHVNHFSASDAELRKVLRCVYEAAHGRQVETQIGLVGIAPPVAPSLKETPFYIKTRVGFFFEVLTRIIGDASHSNSGIQPPQRFGKRPTRPGSVAQKSFEGILIHHEGPVQRLAPAYSLHAKPVEVTNSLQQTK
jgi:hypothetical protein